MKSMGLRGSRKKTKIIVDTSYEVGYCVDVGRRNEGGEARAESRRRI
jgi:hypothetical protein